MKLEAPDLARRVADRHVLRVGRLRESNEAVWQLRDLVAVAHPRHERFVEALSRAAQRPSDKA
jgi:hypothetical protein